MNSMTRNATTLALAISGISGPVFAFADADNIDYSITMATAQAQSVSVTAKFNPEDKILYTFPGARNHENRWGKFFSNIKVVDENGKRVDVVSLGDGKWEMATKSKGEVTLSYTVHMTHEAHEWSGGVDGAAYRRDWGAFFTGRSLFIANGEDKQDISVDFKLPENWKVSASWKTDSADGIKGYAELSDSMLFAGEYEEVLIENDGFELAFVLGGDNLIKKKDEYSRLANGVFTYYKDLLGGAPKTSPEFKVERTLVVVNPTTSQTDGEALGSNISILINDKDPMSNLISRFLFAHEFFHLWNGRSFVPDSLKAEWFKEGISNYYTFKALTSTGSISEQEHIGMLTNFFYGRYSNDKGLGTIAPVQGKFKHKHWGIIYVGGFFAGLYQDFMIREATNNQKSLDNLMAHLYKKHGGTNTAYSLEDLEAELSKLNGKDQSAFFDRYIRGSEVFPITDILKMAGFKAEIKDNRLQVAIDDTADQQGKAIRTAFFGRSNTL